MQLWMILTFSCAYTVCHVGVLPFDLLQTGVDCGGGTCSKCAVGVACATGVDCVQGVCDEQGTKLCLAATCADNVANGDEVGAPPSWMCGGGYLATRPPASACACLALHGVGSQDSLHHLAPPPTHTHSLILTVVAHALASAPTSCCAA